MIFSRKAFCDNFGKKEKCSSTWIFSSRHSVRLTLRKRISPQSRTSGEHSLLSCATHSPQYAPPDSSDSMPIDSRRVLVRILICFWRMFFPSCRCECIGEACVQPSGLSSQPPDLDFPLGYFSRSRERESPALRTRTVVTEFTWTEFPNRPANLIYIFIGTHICTTFGVE